MVQVGRNDRPTLTCRRRLCGRRNAQGRQLTAPRQYLGLEIFSVPAPRFVALRLNCGPRILQVHRRQETSAASNPEKLRPYSIITPDKLQYSISQSANGAVLAAMVQLANHQWALREMHRVVS